MYRKRMLITAGPTHEPIDAVRYLANRSSGRMGVALAAAARKAGWEVTLLLGPVHVAPPANVQVVRFSSTADLEALLDARFPQCDVLVMAAAVADYRPRGVSQGKLARGEQKLVLELEPTPDLVAKCAARRRPDQRVVGFALEEASILDERAAEKLRRKKLDALVANPLATLGASDVTATVYLPDGRRTSPARANAGETGMDKNAFATWLIDWIGVEFRTG
jgi:phosphopantothenoylcysteine decarboxylase/phosphopantothenate--cysteine ligase